MSDKLKRLAKNLSELSLAEVDNLQEVYIRLCGLMSKQKEYFTHLGTDNVIKLLFYIWSYKETGQFEMGDRMINQIAFAILITTEGDNYVESCDDCGGDGYTRCDVCDGTGRVECLECEGTGEENCYACDGEGEVGGETCDECEGTGSMTCTNCDGDENLECSECDGGDKKCDTCDGNGDVQTDEYEYKKYYIVTWSKPIKDRCEITEGDTDITMSEYDFDRLREKYVVLHLEDLHDEFQEYVQSNEMYCTTYTDTPRLYFTQHMEQYFQEDRDVIKNYIV
jgi:hypothetical protein